MGGLKEEKKKSISLKKHKWREDRRGLRYVNGLHDLAWQFGKKSGTPGIHLHGVAREMRKRAA